ncbi:MAG TPA: MbnP family protein [Flavipsychrobacter sp.]|nr:MbnP family protein [Flavipsychrobacter sp.]
MRALLTLAALFSVINCVAQNREVEIQFVPTYNSKEVFFEETWYELPSGDSIIFDVFKCYISDLAFYSKGKKVLSEPESFHLLNSETNLSFSLSLPAAIDYDAIHFNFGIDSATSNSGALGGDLDPAKGMFWTWQSGYINSKIEGRSNLCPTRHHEFAFHLGGYASPDNALQYVSLSVKPAKVIRVEIPLDKFVTGINLKKQHSIMSPGPEAVALSKKLAGSLQSR